MSLDNRWTARGGARPHDRCQHDPGLFKNNHFTEMCCGTEAGSYSRLIDSCITQLKAQGPSRTCNESKEEEEDSRRGSAS